MAADASELQGHEICDFLETNPGSHDSSMALELTISYRPDDWRGKTGAEILSSDNESSINHHKLQLYGFGPGQRPV
jgi:hypothetical protein